LNFIYILIADILVNNATVTDADIFASNGFIHAINKLLVPDDLRTSWN